LRSDSTAGMNWAVEDVLSEMTQRYNTIVKNPLREWKLLEPGHRHRVHAQQES